jgi:hypothetical protein
MAKAAAPNMTAPTVRRIQTEDDMVRHELTKALLLGKQVLPVMIDGASLPIDILPSPLHELKHLHHVRINHDTVFENIPTVIKAIRKHLP